MAFISFYNNRSWLYEYSVSISLVLQTFFWYFALLGSCHFLLEITLFKNISCTRLYCVYFKQKFCTIQQKHAIAVYAINFDKNFLEKKNTNGQGLNFVLPYLLWHLEEETCPNFVCKMTIWGKSFKMVICRLYYFSHTYMFLFHLVNPFTGTKIRYCYSKWCIS